MEPRQGQVDYSVVDAMLAWTRQHEIPLRGHNVFWGIPNRVQPWQKNMDNATLRGTLEARARDIARRYRGQFAEYDLNNEMLHANYCLVRGMGYTGTLTRPSSTLSRRTGEGRGEGAWWGVGRRELAELWRASEPWVLASAGYACGCFGNVPVSGGPIGERTNSPDPCGCGWSQPA